MTPKSIIIFEELKCQFIEVPILRHFDPLLQIIVETDTSKFAISGILLQLFNDNSDPRWHSIAFYSKKLSLVEQRYKIYNRELIAIVFAFKYWRQYLCEARETIVVHSNYNNLKYFLIKKTLSGRQARWAEGLGKFDFLIEYYTRKSNLANGPSHRPDHHKDSTVGKRNENESKSDNSLLPILQAKLRLAFLTLS
jgi:hypothetical protein